MKRHFMPALFAFILVFSAAISVYGWQGYGDLSGITSVTLGEEVSVSPKILNEEKNRETNVTGQVPYVDGNPDLNNRLEKIIAGEKGRALAAGAANITFDYTVVESEEHGTVSFLIYSSYSSGLSLENVSTLVVDGESLMPVKLTDILGGGGPKLCTGVVNNFISEKFRSMPRISSLDSDTDFYVTDGAVYILFDKYEIAPGSEGIQAVPVYFDKLEIFTVLREDCYINREKYNIRMLPLRRASMAFGYRVYWNGERQEITLSKEGPHSTNAVFLKIDDNSYRRAGDAQTQALEAAPEIRDGLAYVPITFMEAILDINYFVMPDGSVELMIYR